MKLISKRAFLLVLVLAIVCLTARYVLCYWCGYYQKSFALMFWQEFLAFIGLVLILIALITWLASLSQGKNRLATTALFGGLLALWALTYVAPRPHDLILSGLKNGMVRNYGSEEMRRFARDFDRLPVLPGPLPNENFYWNNNLIKTGLKEKYPFLANCEAVVEWDNTVRVDWGGFENHWGVCVSVSGKRIDPQPSEPNNRIIRVSDDIYFDSDY